jgi:ubiquinone/menaquinone biosynthesis C-methylase UbiE
MNPEMSRENYEPLRGPVQLCHLFLRERLKPGDRVVDATCGNGHDTLLLAGLVGPSGRVWSFDIDNAALGEVKNRLREASLETEIELIHAGHEHLADHVGEPLRAVVFNLGYLPGGAGDIVTQPKTTLAALEQSVRLLLPGGFILLAVYTGHTGGREEGEAVDSWASGLPSPRFNVWRSSLLNRQAEAPYLLVIEKTA